MTPFLPSLLRLLGVSPDLVQRLDQAEFKFQHPALLVIGLALLVPVGAWIVLRQRSNLPTVPGPLRLVLAACRIAVLAILVLVLASPFIALDTRIENRPLVAVLLDHSQSMGLPAGPYESEAAAQRMAAAAGYQSAGGALDPETRKALNRISRIKLAQTIIRQNQREFVEPLAKKFDLRFFTFGAGLDPVSVDPVRPRLPEPAQPGSPQTRIGDAVLQVISEAAGRPIAGILVFTDGQNTRGPSPVQAAMAAAHVGAPVYAIPCGANTRVRDVAVVDVFTSGMVSQGDTARVAATLESKDFDGRPVKVELRDGDALLDTKDLVLNSAEQQQVELSFVAREVGPHYLTVRVPPLPEESPELRKNNSAMAFLRVSDQKLKVLMIDGAPRWDYRFLKNAMRRDHGLEPVIVLERAVAPFDASPPGSPPAARGAARAVNPTLPKTLDDLARFSTIILGDVAPRVLGRKSLDLIARAVRDKGVGLVIEAGPRHMPRDYAGTELAKLLPVKFLKGVPGLEPRANNPFRLELTPQGAISEVMRLYDDPYQTRAIWAGMPLFYWCAAASRAAPGATVLMTNPAVEGPYGALPLVAYQFAGKGKVMFVGTDATWLWRRNVGDRYYYKFWGQAIRFLARDDRKAGKKGWIEIHPARVEPNEPAEIELVTPAGETDQPPAQAVVQIVGPKGPTTLTLPGQAGAKGRYAAQYTPPAGGRYSVVYDPGNGGAAVKAEFQVPEATEEFRRPYVDRPALKLLASTSNGQMVELPDLDKIPPKLSGEPKIVQLHQEESLWDNKVTLILLVTLFCTDVAIRRLLGLS